MDNKIKQFMVNIFLAAKRFYVFVVTLDAKKVRQRVVSVSAQASSNPLEVEPHQLQEQILLACSYRVDNRQRVNILKTTINKTLGPLAGSGLTVRVLDASPPEFLFQNKKTFTDIPGLALQFTGKEEALPEAYEHLLKQSNEPYFCMVFDDQPIVGLNSEFLQASCRLLEDFKGLVEVVLIETYLKHELEKGNKKLLFQSNSQVWKTRNVRPLGTVQYGKYSFVILKNFHYGFFFNTMVASRQAYLDKLKWYRKYVSARNTHKIELAGGKGLGPSFRYIAVPLEVFMINIDFFHTETSVRGTLGNEWQYYEALKQGYEIKVIQ